MPRTGRSRASARSRMASSVASRAGSISVDATLSAPYRAGSISPPPVRHRPSKTSGSGSFGKIAIGSAPARRIASRYCSRATAFRFEVLPDKVSAIRGFTNSMVFGLAVTFRCSREAGTIDELDEHAISGAWMKEGHKTFDPAARRVIDKLDALVRQAHERASEIVDDEAEMVQRRAATLGDEARHPRLR